MHKLKSKLSRILTPAMTICGIFAIVVSFSLTIDSPNASAAATQFTIKMVHQSGNGKSDGASTALWRSHLNDVIRTNNVNLLTVTEADARGAAAVTSLSNMNAFIAPNKSGANDTAIIWSKADWKLIHAESDKITTLTPNVANHGPAQYANFAILLNKSTQRKILVTASHLPHNDNQGERDMWKNAMQGWNAKRSQLAQKYATDAQIEAGDYNRSLKQSGIPALMSQSLPDMTPVWSAPYPAGGTGHAGSMIDHAYYKGDIQLTAGPRLLPRLPPFSDHGGFLMHFSISGNVDNNGNGTGGGGGGSNNGTPTSGTGGSGRSGGSCDTVILDKSLCQSGVWGLLILLLNLLTAGIGIAAVGGIAWGAFLWTTAGDNSSQIQKAKKTIADVVVGLVSYVLLYAFLQFVIPGGALNILVNPPVNPPPSSGGGGSSQQPSNPPKHSGGGSTTPPAAIKVSDVGIKNLRDASSSTNHDVLKPGVLYRSVDLSSVNVSADQAKKLGKLLGDGATIIDLRQLDDTDPADRNIPGATVERFPTHGFTDMTDYVTRDDVMRSFGKALRRAAHVNGAVLIHCHNGKDRTGWMVAMIMAANGASDSQLMTEYMKSNHQGLVVKPEWLNHGLEKARSKYGSIKKYLKNGLGLSNADLQALQRKFGA